MLSGILVQLCEIYSTSTIKILEAIQVVFSKLASKSAKTHFNDVRRLSKTHDVQKHT